MFKSFVVLSTVFGLLMGSSSFAAASKPKTEQEIINNGLARYSKFRDLRAYVESLKGSVDEGLRGFLLNKIGGTAVNAPAINRDPRGGFNINVGKGSAVPFRILSLKEITFSLNNVKIVYDPAAAPEIIWNQIVAALPRQVSSGALDWFLAPAYAVDPVTMAAVTVLGVAAVGLVAAIANERVLQNYASIAAQCIVARGILEFCVRDIAISNERQCAEWHREFGGAVTAPTVRRILNAAVALESSFMGRHNHSENRRMMQHECYNGLLRIARERLPGFRFDLPAGSAPAPRPVVDDGNTAE